MDISPSQMVVSIISEEARYARGNLQEAHIFPGVGREWESGRAICTIFSADIWRNLLFCKNGAALAIANGKIYQENIKKLIDKLKK